MSDNLSLTQLAAAQANKEVTINDQNAELDAAMTEVVTKVVSTSNAFSLTVAELQRAVVVQVDPDATVPTATIVGTIPTAFKRGMFGLFNNTAQDVTLAVTGQSEAAVAIPTGVQASLVLVDGNVRVFSAGGGGGGSSAGGGGGGSSTFLGLTDTPANFTGSAGKIAAVNTAEDAIEFIAASSGGGGGGGTTFTGPITYNPFIYHGKQSIPNLTMFPDNRSVGAGAVVITEAADALVINSTGTEADRTMLTKAVPTNWKAIDIGIIYLNNTSFESSGAVLIGASGDFVSAGLGTGSGGTNDPEFRVLEWSSAGNFQNTITSINTEKGKERWTRFVRAKDDSDAELIKVFEGTGGKEWIFRGTIVSSSRLGGDAAHVGVQSNVNVEIRAFYYSDDDITPGFDGFLVGNDFYDVRLLFKTTPASDEVLDTIPIGRTLVLPANLTGSVGVVGTNPTASFVISIQDDTVEIGTITVATDGTFTFATTSGTEKTVAAGSILTFDAPATADATIADLSVTILGRV